MFDPPNTLHSERTRHRTWKTTLCTSCKRYSYTKRPERRRTGPKAIKNHDVYAPRCKARCQCISRSTKATGSLRYRFSIWRITLSIVAHNNRFRARANENHSSYFSGNNLDYQPISCSVFYMQEEQQSPKNSH